jgi:aryl-phospho-beta-D-glucosidase BglC (GH1 family)
MTQLRITEKNKSHSLEMPSHRRVNTNNANNNNLPNNVIRMPMQLWTDPSFWENDEHPENFVILNGRKVPNNTTLNELGLTVTQNSVYSDPGNYNVNTMSPLALPPPALVSEPHNKIKRSLAMSKKRKTVKKSKKPKIKSATRNNRFGFKKAFGALKQGFKKITGRSRKNRRS